ncbi:hypothetical protein RDWZM_004724 [Blomia tropicalis]|uniref:Laminin G domain-containing protein n=1 Tax=Blomia tropicalis TaxID=40697 RepID=A0A9Q0M7H2_BLOTA|nr:hypothetical protein RDWZM_004724 [Blomia tropicalis]
MKTNHNSDGLLFFYGPAIDSERNVPDFMAVALNQSHLEMTFDLGAGIGHIRTEVSVVDDRVHDVFVKLSGRTGTIMVDGISFSDTSPGSLTSLNSVGDIYFGGVPHYSSMTGARYNAGYVGCIWDIEIGISGVLDLISSTKRSRNIMPCEDESSQVEVDHFLGGVILKYQSSHSFHSIPMGTVLGGGLVWFGGQHQFNSTQRLLMC